jgi:signal transduction histidine kinase
MLSSQKMASLGTLVAGVAHEINSPLQVITGVSESLLNLYRNGGVPPERLERNLTMIHRNGARVAGLVRALRLYAHTSEQVLRPDHLNEIVADTLLLIEHQLQSWSNITVRADLAPDLPEMACDREKLAQALINLLTNARDAMPAGGEIAISTRYDPAADELNLSISDDGQGIPAEIQSRVFDPFFTTKPLGQGTGLGLSVVLGVIQTHHGRISLHSVIKEGTRFNLTFPRLQPPAGPGQPLAPLQIGGGRFDQV